MNRKTTLMIAGILFMQASLEAAVLYPLNGLKVIEVKISNHDLTRIAVQDDRIQNVFGNSGDYSLESDEIQGHVFIRPVFTRPLKETPISITLTTEKGHTQDLRLVPKDIPSETLILTKKDTSLAPRKGATVPLHRKEVEDLLKACQEKGIPQGYREIPVNLRSSLQPYPLTRELRGRILRGLIFKLSAPVSEVDFSQACGIPKKDIVAILISPNPKTGGHAYVVARTHP